MRQLFKIVVIGEGGIGKTTTIHSIYSYLKNKFPFTSYKSDQNGSITDTKNVNRTKFIDFHTISFAVDNQKVVYQIWDLKGQRFPSNNAYTSLNPLDHITETIVKNSDLILLAFDSSDNATFNELFREGGFFEIIKPFVALDQEFLLLATITDLLKESKPNNFEKIDISHVFNDEPETISFNNIYLENVSVLSEKILDLLQINYEKKYQPLPTTNQSISLRVYK